MKKFRGNVIALLLAILGCISLGTSLLGCNSNKQEVSPEDTTKYLLDFMFKDDSSEIEKLGAKKKECEETREKFEEEFIEGVEAAFAKQGDASITDEVKEKLTKDMLEGLKKLEYTVELVSKEEDTAEVKISMRGWDMEKISSDIIPEITEEVKENPNMSDEEIYALIFGAIGTKLREGILVDEPTDVTITLKNTNGSWDFSDESQFYKIGMSIAK